MAERAPRPLALAHCDLRLRQPASTTITTALSRLIVPPRSLFARRAYPHPSISPRAKRTRMGERSPIPLVFSRPIRSAHRIRGWFVRPLRATSGRLLGRRPDARSGRVAVAADDTVRASAGADESEREPLAGRHARSSSISSVCGTPPETPPSRAEQHSGRMFGAQQHLAAVGRPRTTQKRSGLAVAEDHVDTNREQDHERANSYRRIGEARTVAFASEEAESHASRPEHEWKPDEKRRHAGRRQISRAAALTCWSWP
jgi:hypothetical protein